MKKILRGGVYMAYKPARMQNKLEFLFVGGGGSRISNNFFVKSFISLLLLHTIFFLLIVLYFPHIPFRLESTALLLVIGNVLLDLGVPCVEAMCCVTTQVHAHTMPALVLDYWLPAENIFLLVCTVVRRA